MALEKAAEPEEMKRRSVSCTSADMDNRAVEAGQSLAELAECRPPIIQPAITDLLDEIANQKEEVAKKSEEVSRAHVLLAAGRDERDRLRKQVIKICFFKFLPLLTNLFHVDF
jgi:hypothetical protein